SGVKPLPLAVRGRLQRGNALRGDLAVQLVQLAVVAVLGRPEAVRILVRTLGGLFRVNDLLGRVLAKALDPKGGQQRVAVGEANEQPQRASLQGLVAQVLHEGRRHVVRVGLVRHLQVENLQHARPAQVEAERLPGSLDETDHLSVLLGDVHQGFLRQGQQRGKRRAEQRPQSRGGRFGLAQANVRRAVHLFDAREVEQAGGSHLHWWAPVFARRTNSRCKRRSPLSSG